MKVVFEQLKDKRVRASLTHDDGEVCVSLNKMYYMEAEGRDKEEARLTLLFIINKDLEMSSRFHMNRLRTVQGLKS